MSSWEVEGNQIKKAVEADALRKPDNRTAQLFLWGILPTAGLATLQLSEKI